MLKKITIISLLLSFALMGVGQAQNVQLPDPGLLPDSPFYFLKRGWEGLGTFFTFGDSAKAERFAKLAEKRLSEARALAEKGKSEHAVKATERYEDTLSKSLERANKAKEKGKDVNALLTRISERSSKHLEVLAEVSEKVPEQAKKAIQKVIERKQSKDVLQKAMEVASRKSVPDFIEVPAKGCPDGYDQVYDLNTGEPVCKREGAIGTPGSFSVEGEAVDRALTKGGDVLTGSILGGVVVCPEGYIDSGKLTDTDDQLFPSPICIDKPPAPPQPETPPKEEEITLADIPGVWMGELQLLYSGSYICEGLRFDPLPWRVELKMATTSSDTFEGELLISNEKFILKEGNEARIGTLRLTLNNESSWVYEVHNSKVFQSAKGRTYQGKSGPTMEGKVSIFEEFRAIPTCTTDRSIFKGTKVPS